MNHGRKTRVYVCKLMHFRSILYCLAELHVWKSVCCCDGCQGTSPPDRRPRNHHKLPSRYVSRELKKEHLSLVPVTPVKNELVTPLISFSSCIIPNKISIRFLSKCRPIMERICSRITRLTANCIIL